MIRTFQPVGMGTFITEQFEQGQNVVFDCGSSTSAGLVTRLIRTNFDENQLIQAVFISSLDMEHASGLEALMKWCCIKKVFIPFLREDERAYTLFKYLCEGGDADDFLGRLIMDPKYALSEYSILPPGGQMVTQVVPESAEEVNLFDDVVPADLMAWRAIDGFRVSVEVDADWIYYVRAYDDRQGLEQLTDALIEVGGDPAWVKSAATLQQAWQQDSVRHVLQQAYDLCSTWENVVTLAIYSGPQNRDYYVFEQFTPLGKWSFVSRVHAGGIYTGGLCLENEQIRMAFLEDFRKYRVRTGSFLLPGHGSRDLFHESFLPKNHAILVVTSSTENVLCLPHGNVIRMSMERRLPLYVVTEAVSSAARFYITDSAVPELTAARS